ncbi:MAG TPA: VCBS repeat-containing protein [Gemmata sp.]|nr:VCBS repeat-containing protein [Gemmata sp.]
MVAPGPFREGEPIRVSREIDFTPSSRGLPDFSLADFAVADWDRDGKPDLLVRQGLPDGKGGLYWYRNLGGDGMPELAEGKLLLGPESLGTNWATSRVPGFCVADWNGDGWPDLVLTRDAVLPAAAPDKQADWRGTVVVYLRE